MDLMTRVIRRLIPLRIGEKFRAVVDAIAASVETLYQAIRGIVTEANPGTAESTLAQWYAQMGIRYDPSLSVRQQQDIARLLFAGFGGQSQSAINEQVKRVFPDVDVFIEPRPTTSQTGRAVTGLAITRDYPSWYPGAAEGEYPLAYYRVVGSVPLVQDRDRLTAILARIAPAEMEPAISVTVDALSTTAKTGRSITGYSVTGWTEQIKSGVAGRALTGLGVTGLS